jgi:hypothetical protein
MPIDPRRIELLDPVVAAILRRKTPAEKLQAAFDSNEFVREVMAAGIRRQHPTWTAEEVRGFW